MTTLAQVALTCPSCRRKCLAMTYMSTNNFGPFHTDLYQQPAGSAAVPYDVAACPSCGRADAVADFRRARSWSDELPRAIQGTEAHMALAAQHAERQSAPQVIFDAWLQASWCAREESQADLERCSQANALHWLRQAMTDERTDAELVAVAAYLVGELMRRQGDCEGALKWWQEWVPQPWPDQWEPLLSVVWPLAEHGDAQAVSLRG